MKELNSSVIRCEIFTFDGTNNINNFIERVTGYRAESNKKLDIKKESSSKKTRVPKIKLTNEEITAIEEIIKTNPRKAKKSNVILKLSRGILQRIIAKEENTTEKYVGRIQASFLSEGMNVFKRKGVEVIELTDEEILTLKEILSTDQKQARKANVILKLSCGVSPMIITKEEGLTKSHVSDIKTLFLSKGIDMFERSSPKIKLTDEEVLMLKKITKTNPRQAKKANIVLKLGCDISRSTIAKEECVSWAYVNNLKTSFLSKGMDVFSRSKLFSLKIKLTDEEIKSLEEIHKTNPRQARKAIIILKLSRGILQDTKT